jgi:hypothetical protein
MYKVQLRCKALKMIDLIPDPADEYIGSNWGGELMDKHKGTRTINSNTTADFHADYATLFVVLHKNTS